MRGPITLFGAIADRQTRGYPQWKGCLLSVTHHRCHCHHHHNQENHTFAYVLKQIRAIDCCLEKVLTVRMEGKPQRQTAKLSIYSSRETALQNEGAKSLELMGTLGDSQVHEIHNSGFSRGDSQIRHPQSHSWRRSQFIPYISPLCWLEALDSEEERLKLDEAKD
ncbi:uncharacterized protein ACOB8E_014468 [Sarcophilus harrisii]